MVKENSVACEHIVGFSVIYGDPVRIQLCRTVRTLGIERRLFALRRRLRDSSEQLGSRSLIEAAGSAVDTDRLQQLESTYPGSLRRILRHLEGHAYVRLRRQIIYLCRADLCDQAHQIARICRICKVHEKLYFIIIGMNEVIDPCRVADAVSANQSVNLIALLQKKLCQIGAVLSCDTRDQCYFLHNVINSFLISKSTVPIFSYLPNPVKRRFLRVFRSSIWSSATMSPRRSGSRGPLPR